MFYNEVTKYETKDKSLFDTEKSAEQYIINSLCENIEKIIDSELKDSLTLKYADKVKIITALVGSSENIARLFTAISKVV